MGRPIFRSVCLPSTPEPRAGPLNPSPAKMYVPSVVTHWPVQPCFPPDCTEAPQPPWFSKSPGLNATMPGQEDQLKSHTAFSSYVWTEQIYREPEWRGGVDSRETARPLCGAELALPLAGLLGGLESPGLRQLRKHHASASQPPTSEPNSCPHLFLLKTLGTGSTLGGSRCSGWRRHRQGEQGSPEHPERSLPPRGREAGEGREDLGSCGGYGAEGPDHPTP